MMPMLGIQVDVGTKDYINVIGMVHQFPKPRARCQWSITLVGSVYPQGWGPHVTTSGWGGAAPIVLKGSLDDEFNITTVPHAGCAENFNAPDGLLILLQNGEQVVELSCANQNVTITNRERIQLPDEAIPPEPQFHR
jgi:hypothetical protein